MVCETSVDEVLIVLPLLGISCPALVQAPATHGSLAEWYVFGLIRHQSKLRSDFLVEIRATF